MTGLALIYVALAIALLAGAILAHAVYTGRIHVSDK